MSEKSKAPAKSPQAAPAKAPGAARQTMARPFDGFAALQRGLGNRGLGQWLSGGTGGVIQRKCSCGGECPKCRNDEATGAIQTKLSIGPAGDHHERQADSIAAQVMRSSGESVALPAMSKPGAHDHASEGQVHRRAEGGAPGQAVDLSGDTLTRGGQPLPGAVRSYFEPRFGRDFSDVRVHTGSFAETANLALRAQAFTYGQHIWLGSGQSLAPTPLLAHELVHTLQQGGGVIRRAPDPAPAPSPDDLIPYPIVIPAGLSSGLELYRYAELKIFGRVVNIRWDPSTGAQKVLDNPSAYAGRTINFKVRRSSLAATSGGQPTADAKAAADKAYAGMGQQDRDAVNAEIDKRYFESVQETPGTQIKKGETGKIAIWNSFKQQVMADKARLEALPPAVKELFGGDANITPDKYPKLNRLADSLSKFTAADLSDYKSKINATTTDLDELQRSIDAYLAAKAAREAERESRENLVTKLWGAEGLYEEYKNLGKEPAKLERQARDQTVQGAGHLANQTRQRAQQIRQQEIVDFTAKLKQYDFNSIPEFEQYLNDYEAAFLKESVAIVNDILDKYQGKLFEAEKHYSQDANVDALLSQVQSSGAPQLVEQAKGKMAEAGELSKQGSFQRVQGAGHLANETSNKAGQRMNEAKALVDQGSQLVRNLPGHPMINDEKFPRAVLLQNDRGAAKSAIASFIAARRSDIATCRTDLAADPKIVYKLPEVMQLSMQQQGLVAGSLPEKLISDRRANYVGDHARIALILGIIGVALALLIPGGGAIAAVAAVGALGLSGYQAVQEFKEYESKSAFAGVGLGQDPTPAWLIISVVAVVADMGAAVAAVKSIKAAGALKSFEATSDVAQFEKDLAAIQELNAAQRANVVRAAQLQKQARQALMAGSGSALAVVPSLTVMALHAAGRLGIMAFYAIRGGAHSFVAWLQELKAARIIANAQNLTADELKALKAAWAEGKQLTKQVESNIPELEQAMKEFRAETGIGRSMGPTGKVQGGTTAAAKTEIQGVSQSVFKEGSTRSKGAAAATVKNNSRYQSPQAFGGTKNHAEQNILGDIADEIDKAKGFGADLKGTPKPGASGKIHLHVEQELCSACRQGIANPDVLPGVVKQFSTEYPNITLVVTNQRTGEVMFLRNGKALIL